MSIYLCFLRSHRGNCPLMVCFRSYHCHRLPDFRLPLYHRKNTDFHHRTLKDQTRQAFYLQIVKDQTQKAVRQIGMDQNRRAVHHCRWQAHPGQLCFHNRPVMYSAHLLYFRKKSVHWSQIRRRLCNVCWINREALKIQGFQGQMPLFRRKVFAQIGSKSLHFLLARLAEPT